MPRPLVATIDLAAMRHNLDVAKAHAPHAKVWAVVKANAYGHGLARAMRAFAAADGLALIEVDAAVRLRELGWTKRILLLEGFFDMDDVPSLLQHDIDIVVHSRQQLDMLESTTAPGSINVQLKMNSGMNRLGFKPDVYRAAYQRLRTMRLVKDISFLTHFANAEDAANPHLPMAEQMKRFLDATSGLPGERCMANSAADLLHPEVTDGWIRPGVMLYGGTPCDASAEKLGLLPAMTLTSEIIGVQEITAGDAVGYGSRFVADRAMKIGIVACGYADGYPRHAPTGTPVNVNGVRTCVVGRVSMDMITVDLTPVAGADVGSAVTLWGEGLPIDEVAQAAGTIGYELMCAIAPRVKMIER